MSCESTCVQLLKNFKKGDGNSVYTATGKTRQQTLMRRFFNIVKEQNL